MKRTPKPSLFDLAIVGALHAPRDGECTICRKRARVSGYGAHWLCDDCWGPGDVPAIERAAPIDPRPLSTTEPTDAGTGSRLTRRR